jgi:SHS2 domain-containing protein
VSGRSDESDREVFAHGADWGVRGRGASVEEAFRNAARAMFSLVVEDLSTVRPRERIEVEAQAPDPELLFVDWLNALLAGAGEAGIVLGDCSLRVEGNRARGEARGEPYDPARHAGGTEVKGATLSGLRVGREGDRWVAECIVDV